MRPNPSWTLFAYFLLFFLFFSFFSFSGPSALHVWFSPLTRTLPTPLPFLRLTFLLLN